MLAEKEEAWHTLFAYVQFKIFLESVKSLHFTLLNFVSHLVLIMFTIVQELNPVRQILTVDWAPCQVR